MILFILFLLTINTDAASEIKRQKITFKQADSIIAAVVMPGKEMVKYGLFQPASIEAFNKAATSSRFIMFAVAIEAGEGLDNYYIDLYTGDVFITLMECTEEKNKKLEVLQKRIRQSLHLTHAEYKRIKTKGPMCDE
jgi:hypothetical protein